MSEQRGVPVRVKDVVTVEEDYDTGVYFDAGEYGMQVGARAWERYQAALAEASRLRALMERSKRRTHAPLPPPGSIGRKLHDMMIEDIRRGFAVWPMLSRPNPSQDDGSIERLRKALEP